VDDQRWSGKRPRALPDNPNRVHYCANPGERSPSRAIETDGHFARFVMPDVDGLGLVRDTEPIRTRRTSRSSYFQPRKSRREGGGLYRRRERLPCQLPDKIELIARIQYHFKGLSGISFSAMPLTVRFGESMERLHCATGPLEAITQGVTIRHSEALGSSIIYANSASPHWSDIRSKRSSAGPRTQFIKPARHSAPTLGLPISRPRKQVLKEDMKLVRKDGTFVTGACLVRPHHQPDGGATITSQFTRMSRRPGTRRVADGGPENGVCGPTDGGIAHDFKILLAAIKSNARRSHGGFKDNRCSQSNRNRAGGG